MPTNRPFLTNILAAFRAHSAIQNASSSSPSVSTTAATVSTQQTHITTSNTQPALSNPSTAPSSARAITTKSQTTAGITTAAVQAAGHLSHTRHSPASPPARSSISPRSPGSNFGNRQRRGSDSSSEGGFRDALGNEKWYIGGRTAQGEERFYRLGMVRREKSGDRLSIDRLSLWMIGLLGRSIFCVWRRFLVYSCDSIVYIHWKTRTGCTYGSLALAYENARRRKLCVDLLLRAYEKRVCTPYS